MYPIVGSLSTRYYQGSVRIVSVDSAPDVSDYQAFAFCNLQRDLSPPTRRSVRFVSGDSPPAEYDQRLCLWKLPPFEKGGRKLLILAAIAVYSCLNLIVGSLSTRYYQGSVRFVSADSVPDVSDYQAFAFCNLQRESSVPTRRFEKGGRKLSVLAAIAVYSC